MTQVMFRAAAYENDQKAPGVVKIDRIDASELILFLFHEHIAFPYPEGVS